MDNINYDKRVFKPVANTENGEVSGDTTFFYHQNGDIVTAEYSGGEIVRGHLIASVSADGALDMRYHHINKNGEIMTGKCLSTPEVLPDGRIRLHEMWQWTGGDHSTGESVIEEVK